MSPDCLQYYSQKIETTSYATSYLGAHTMPSDSLRRYVVDTKFSDQQAGLLRQTITDRIPIEVHGIYSEHLESVLQDLSLRVVASAVRNPRRFKRYNVHRPLVLRVRAHDGAEKLWIVAFPSREYVQQVSELAAAFVQSVCDDSSITYDGVPLAIHYDNCDRRLEDWSGLRRAASQVVRAGDLALLGYVDEIGRLLCEHGYSKGAVTPIDAGSFGEIFVVEKGRTSVRAVLVGVYHTYWGSAAGLICSSLARAGATDIVYVSKAGTLIGEDYVHQVVNPDIYYVLEQRSGRREDWKRWHVPSRLRLEFPELVSGLGSGVHLTVPSVMSETIEQSEQYRSLRPATIDNEAGYIARELNLHNDLHSASRRTSFSSIHFLTDYLRTTSDARTRDAMFDLSSVAAKSGSEVQQELNDALVKTSAIVASYLEARAAPSESALDVFVPYPLPAISNWVGRMGETSALERLLLSRSRASDGGAVQVFGGPGVGKTRLVSAVCRGIVELRSFEFVVWLSLRPDPSTGSAPLLDATIDKLLVGTANGQDDELGVLSQRAEKIDALLHRLAERRCLVVFDDTESVLEAGNSPRAGYFAKRYPEYRELFRSLSQRSDGSVVVILSREKLAELHLPWCVPQKVTGLDVSAAIALLRTLGLDAPDEILATLATRYAGNPKALELVAPIVLDDPAFDGAVEVFLSEHTWALTSDLDQLLSEVFARLGLQERQALRRIAVYDATLVPLRAPAIVAQMPELSPQEVYDVVIHALLRRNLLDDGQQFGAYALHPMIQEKALRELAEKAPDLLRAHRSAYEYLYRLPRKPKTEWRFPNDVGSLIAAMKHACAAHEWLAAAQIACNEAFRRGLVKWGAHPQILDAYQALANAPTGIEETVNSDIRSFRAIAANMNGIALRNLGRSEEAIASLKDGLGGADDKWRAIILGNLCLALIDAGDHGEAISVASQARELAIQVGDRRAQSYALGNLGIAYFGMNDLPNAKEALIADLALSDGSNDEGEAHAHAVLGAIALEEREFDEALRRLRIALRAFRSLGNSFREREFLPILSSAFAAAGAPYAMALCLRRCETLAKNKCSTHEVDRIVRQIESVSASLNVEERERLRAMSEAEVNAALDGMLSDPSESET